VVDGLFDPVQPAAGDEVFNSAGDEPRSLHPAEAAARQLLTSSVYSGGAEGLSQFKRGFLKFKAEVIDSHAEHFRELAASQSPKVMVIACCDSRVDPALLMGAGPGDIFIVRCVLLRAVACFLVRKKRV
jgi:hypothetical protein